MEAYRRLRGSSFLTVSLIVIIVLSVPTLAAFTANWASAGAREWERRLERAYVPQSDEESHHAIRTHVGDTLHYGTVTSDGSCAKPVKYFAEFASDPGACFFELYSVREEEETNVRFETYSCGKNQTCTRTVVDTEWVVRERDSSEVDRVTFAGMGLPYQFFNTGHHRGVPVKSQYKTFDSSCSYMSSTERVCITGVAPGYSGTLFYTSVDGDVDSPIFYSGKDVESVIADASPDFAWWLAFVLTFALTCVPTGALVFRLGIGVADDWKDGLD